MADVKYISIDETLYDLRDPKILDEAIASEYSASATYAVGDYCSYDGKLYKCTTAIDTAEAWDSTHWTSIKVMDVKADKANPVFTGSISLGRKENTNVGEYSTAVGLVCTASGDCSHAEGANAKASGYCSHAEGAATVASGNLTHVEGEGTVASGKCSHVFGINNFPDSDDYYPLWAADTEYKVGDIVKATSGTTTNTYYCKQAHKSGSTFIRGNYWYNVGDIYRFVEIVGNGFADSLSNARSLDWYGNEYLKGDLYVRCNNQSTVGHKVIDETGFYSTDMPLSSGDATTVKQYMDSLSARIDALDPETGVGIFQDVAFSIASDAWTSANNVWTYTWSNALLTAAAGIDVFYDSSFRTALAGDIDVAKSTGYLTFTTNKAPIGTLTGTIRIIDSIQGIVPVARGGTGSGTAAGARDALEIYANTVKMSSTDSMTISDKIGAGSYSTYADFFASNGVGFSSGIVAANAADSPYTGSTDALQMKYTSNYGVQFSMRPSESRIYYKRINAGTWSDWVSITMDSRFPYNWIDSITNLKNAIVNNFSGIFPVTASVSALLCGKSRTGIVTASAISPEWIIYSIINSDGELNSGYINIGTLAVTINAKGNIYSDISWTIAPNSGLSYFVCSSDMITLQYSKDSSTSLTNGATIGTIQTSAYRPYKGYYAPLIDYSSGKPLGGSVFIGSEGAIKYYGDSISGKQISFNATWPKKSFLS